MKNKQNIHIIVILLVIFFIVMSVRFYILQPEKPIFEYNGSTFSISNNIYSDKDIWKSNTIEKNVDKNTLAFFYKFNFKRELESYMVPKYSEIYLINDKPLKGTASDTVLVKFSNDIEYKGKLYKKGNLYISNRIIKNKNSKK